MRIIARSSSNRNSARARASSVLPTPVGPRKMKLPIGRFGSFSPLRARITASATAVTASSWPMTRLCSSSSRCSSFSISPSSSFVTGTPVQRLTTAAMSSSPTSSLTQLVGLVAVGGVASCGLELSSRARGACRTSARRPGSGRTAARPARSRCFVCSICSRSSADLLDRLLLGLPLRLQGVGVGLQVGQLLLQLRRAGPCDAGSVSFLSASRSISSCITRRLISSSSVGMRVDLGAQLGRRLVHQVDGLVRQEAVGDVAVRQHRRRHQGRVLDADAVVRPRTAPSARAGSRSCPRPIG